MEDHFNSILGPLRSKSSQEAHFIPSSSYSASKNGYFFANGDRGLGYYEDVAYNASHGIKVHHSLLIFSLLVTCFLYFFIDIDTEPCRC